MHDNISTTLHFAADLLDRKPQFKDVCQPQVLQKLVQEANRRTKSIEKGLKQLHAEDSNDTYELINTILQIDSKLSEKIATLSQSWSLILEKSMNEASNDSLEYLEASLKKRGDEDLCCIVTASQNSAMIWLPAEVAENKQILIFCPPGKIKVIKSLSSAVKIIQKLLATSASDAFAIHTTVSSGSVLVEHEMPDENPAEELETQKETKQEPFNAHYEQDNDDANNSSDSAVDASQVQAPASQNRDLQRPEALNVAPETTQHGEESGRIKEEEFQEKQKASHPETAMTTEESLIEAQAETHEEEGANTADESEESHTYRIDKKVSISYPKPVKIMMSKDIDRLFTHQSESRGNEFSRPHTAYMDRTRKAPLPSDLQREYMKNQSNQRLSRPQTSTVSLGRAPLPIGNTEGAPDVLDLEDPLKSTLSGLKGMHILDRFSTDLSASLESPTNEAQEAELSKDTAAVSSEDGGREIDKAEQAREPSLMPTDEPTVEVDENNRGSAYEEDEDLKRIGSQASVENEASNYLANAGEYYAADKVSVADSGALYHLEKFRNLSSSTNSGDRPSTSAPPTSTPPLAVMHARPSTTGRESSFQNIKEYRQLSEISAAYSVGDDEEDEYIPLPRYRSSARPKTSLREDRSQGDYILRPRTTSSQPLSTLPIMKTDVRELPVPPEDEAPPIHPPAISQYDIRPQTARAESRIHHYQQHRPQTSNIRPKEYSQDHAYVPKPRVLPDRPQSAYRRYDAEAASVRPHTSSARKVSFNMKPYDDTVSSTNISDGDDHDEITPVYQESSQNSLEDRHVNMASAIEAEVPEFADTEITREIIAETSEHEYETEAQKNEGIVLEDPTDDDDTAAGNIDVISSSRIARDPYKEILQQLSSSNALDISDRPRTSRATRLQSFGIDEFHRPQTAMGRVAYKGSHVPGRPTPPAHVSDRVEDNAGDPLFNFSRIRPSTSSARQSQRPIGIPRPYTADKKHLPEINFEDEIHVPETELEETIQSKQSSVDLQDNAEFASSEPVLLSPYEDEEPEEQEVNALPASVRWELERIRNQVTKSHASKLQQEREENKQVKQNLFRSLCFQSPISPAITDSDEHATKPVATSRQNDIIVDNFDQDLERLRGMRLKKLKELEARNQKRIQRRQETRQQQQQETEVANELVPRDAPRPKTQGAAESNRGMKKTVERPVSCSAATVRGQKAASNRKLIRNAVEMNLLAGTHLLAEKEAALDALESTSDKYNNYLVLFRGDKAMRFRGLYGIGSEEKASRVYGKGPLTLTREMVKQFYRYNSGRKEFSAVPTRSFTTRTDAAALDEVYLRHLKKTAYKDD